MCYSLTVRILTIRKKQDGIVQLENIQLTPKEGSINVCTTAGTEAMAGSC